MHVRETAASNTTVLVLTTENNRVSVDGANGVFELTVSATDMANVVADKYVYDLEIIAPVSGTVNRLLYGNFVVRAEVTR
jgi:hypothetical protein